MEREMDHSLHEPHAEEELVPGCWPWRMWCACACTDKWFLQAITSWIGLWGEEGEGGDWCPYRGSLEGHFVYSWPVDNFHTSYPIILRKPVIRNHVFRRRPPVMQGGEGGDRFGVLTNGRKMLKCIRRWSGGENEALLLVVLTPQNFNFWSDDAGSLSLRFTVSLWPEIFMF